jgi:hypothetical protein
MDKKNVLKSIWQNLFGKKRAALGDLRNFFGRKIMAPLWCDSYERDAKMRKWALRYNGLMIF